MRGLGVTGFQDLDGLELAHGDVLHTDGFITTNPDIVMHVNPADCGEIALHGFSKRHGTEVAAMVHAGRRIVDEGGHMRPIEYMCQTHDIEPSELTAWFGPSARADSYRFPVIEAEQHASDRWRDYLEYKGGHWHVDVHGRAVDDLLAFGISAENMTINKADTSAPGANYFSYRQYKNGDQQTFATNGFFFALRGEQAIPRASVLDASVAAPIANAAG
jgi:copper oxidase (laccase) domain-containing protein